MFKAKKLKLITTQRDAFYTTNFVVKIPKFTVPTMTVLGQELATLTVVEFLINTYYAKRLLSKICDKEDYAYNIIGPIVSQEWIDAVNNLTVENHKKSTAKIDAKYKMLSTICKDNKTDMKALEELKGLLYCEADNFMNATIKRIEKRSNAKNLKLYKAMKTYQEKPIITCEM